MKSPRAVWEGCSEDARWIDDQVKVVEEIMREAFAAGFVAGTEQTARCVGDHIDAIASNLAMRVPESVPRGLRVLVTRARELGMDAPTMQRAWREAVGGVGRPAIALLPSNEGAKLDMHAGGGTR